MTLLRWLRQPLMCPGGVSDSRFDLSPRRDSSFTPGTAAVRGGAVPGAAPLLGAGCVGF